MRKICEGLIPNFQWKQDKNGDVMPEPVDAFNHAIDSIRYALEDDMTHRKARAIASLWG